MMGSEGEKLQRDAVGERNCSARCSITARVSFLPGRDILFTGKVYLCIRSRRRNGKQRKK